MPTRIASPLVKGLTDFYNIEHKIGKGGFGTVYRASHKETGDIVAVKLVDKHDPHVQDDLHRIQQEVKTLESLDHPNICKLFKQGETERYIFMIMEYCPGGELFDYLVSKDRLSEQEARKILIDVMLSIAYLHDKNITHRDLKPENILLDHNNNIKLIDFGLCSRYQAIDKLSTACGSYAYAPPELYSGKPYDGRLADIWSLGVILYALLTGQLPFPGGDAQMQNSVRNYRDDLKMPKWISNEAQHILRCMIARDPAHRVSAKDLLGHSWCMMDADHARKRLNSFDSTSESSERLDEDVISLMARGLSCSSEELTNIISRWDYTTEEVAVYNILCVRKRVCGNSFGEIPLQTSGIRVRSRHALKVKKSLEEEFSKEAEEAPPVLPPRKYHTSMEGGLDDVNLLEFASPKSKDKVDKGLESEEFARPRIPTPRKQKPTDGVAFLTGTIVPAKSADSGLNDTPRTPARERWMAMEPKTPVTSYPSPSPSRRKILGSLERGMDKVRSMLTPRSTKTKKIKILKYTGRKEAYNVTCTGATDADCVLEQLKSSLEELGATYKDNGYCLVGKWQERAEDNSLTGKQVKFELEVVLVNENTPVGGVGIRRKRVNGDGWLYKNVVDQILTLTPICKLPSKEVSTPVRLQTMV